MRKNEIIESTLRAMRGGQGLLSPETPNSGNADEYEEIVIAQLNKRLPEGDTKTCEDFKYLNVECCESCHIFYAHYDMHLDSMPDTTKAWICCCVRSALLDPDSKAHELQELLDLELAFGGKLPRVDVVSADRTRSKGQTTAVE